MNRDAGHRNRQTGLHQGHPGQVVFQVGALVVASPDHVLDGSGVDTGPLYQVLHDRDAQIQRGHSFVLPA